jgi:hypothetical protein
MRTTWLSVKDMIMRQNGFKLGKDWGRNV